MNKRILSALLLVAMLLTMVPVMAFAEEVNAVVDENAGDTNVSGDSGDSQSEEPVDLTDLYVQKGLAALYTTLGEYASTADLSTGKWTDLVSGATATFVNPSRWSIGANGGVGFDVFYGAYTDAGTAATTADGKYNVVSTISQTNVATTGVKLNFGIEQLPTEDFTLEFLAMYKPVYMADYEKYAEDGTITYALDANGKRVEAYNVIGDFGGGSPDFGAFDRIGFISSYSTQIDGSYQSGGRGAVYWLINAHEWGGNNGNWLGGGAWGSNGGLNIQNQVFKQNDVINTYGIFVDETYDATTEVTSAHIGLYRNATLYKDNSNFMNSTEGTAGTGYNAGDFGGNQFYLSSTKPTDFYAVRIYEAKLTTEEQVHNRAVDVLLYYGIELSAAAAEDETKLPLILAYAANQTLVTDAAAKAAKKAEIQTAIETIVPAPSTETLYVQNGLESLFTAFEADSGKGIMKDSTGITWLNRVSGKSAATFVGSAWQVEANGGVGRDVIYGTLYTTVNGDGSKTYTFGAHNDRNTYWATTDHKLSLGLDLLPKDDFTVEYLAFYPPQYSVDNATGDLVPTSDLETLLNGTASGGWVNPETGATVEFYPYQITWVDKIGFLTFITDNPHGHIESQPAGALRPRAENSGCTQWGGTSGNGGDVYGWGDIGYTVDNRNIGRIATYGLMRDEVVLADGVNIEATYSQMFDGAVAKSKVFKTADGKIVGNGNNTGSQYFFGDDDTDFYLSHRIGAHYYALRVYSRTLDETERAQNMMADAIYFYDLSVSDELLADEEAYTMLVNTLASTTFERDAAAKAAKKAELQAFIDNIADVLAKTDSMTSMFAASENLTALYTIYVPESVNIATGTWSNLLDASATPAVFEDAVRWSVNENGSIGYTAWVGSITDDGVTKNTIAGSDSAYMGLDGTNHGRKRAAKLNLGLDTLPVGDMTVEFMAMAKPVYVADAEESSASKVVYAKDANGDYLHAYNVFGAQYFNIMDYGTPSNISIDQVGFFGTISPVQDGAYWGGGRGAVHWMLETSWSSDRTGVGTGAAWGGSWGLNVNGNPFWTHSVIRTYGISIEETTVEIPATDTTEATTKTGGILSMYRNGGFYNSNADLPIAYEHDAYAAGNAGFYLSAGRPTDFYTVRVYDKVLTNGERLQNHMVDLLLFYDLELPLDFIADEDMMADLAANVASLPFETDMMAANAVALQIEDLIQSIYQTSKIYKMYVQDGLVANYTALSPNDTTASIATGAWVNRVAGGQSATMGNSQYWRRNANGSVGYDIFYGTTDANGAFVAESSFNNYAVNGTRLDLGLAQLPKDNFTVEFVAQLNPVYVADAEGNKIGESYLMGSVPGSQQYGAAAYGAVYQLGYFAGFTTNRDGVHGGYTARGAIIWTTSATAWNWQNSTQVSGWNKSTNASITDIYTPNGSVHTYAIQRTEFDDPDAENYRGATYVVSRDLIKYAERTLTKAAMDEATSKNASYQPVDYATDDTGYFYLGERVSIDYYAVRVYNRNLDAAEQARNHFVDIVLYYGLKLDNRIYDDEELIRASATALMGATIETDASLKAALRAQYQARLDDAVLMSEIVAGGDYDSLYVQSGLVGLYTAFAADSSIDLMNGTWNNKMDNEYGAATIKGTAFWVRNPVGISYRLSDKQFSAAGRGVGLDLPNSFENLSNFSVEAFAAVVGVTDQYGNRYVNNYQAEVKDEEGNVIEPAKDRIYGWYLSDHSTFRFGLLNSLFFASLDANNDSQALTSRWYLMNKAYGNSIPSATEADQVMSPDGKDQFDRGWNRIGKEAIVPSTMLAQKKTTGSDIYYGLFYNGSETASVEKTITAAREAELIAATTATTNRFSLFNGLPADIYAIRVYNRELTAAEKLQNAFVDKVALYNVDITGFEDLSPDKKTALYQQFASVSTTMADPARVQAIYDFFATGNTATMAKTLVAFEGYSPILVKGESGYRVTFSVNSDAYSLLKDAGYTVTYGALVAPGGAHNTIENVTVGKSGVKNIVVEGANGSGIYYQLAGARGYNFTAAVTADTVAELGIDVIVRGYVTLTKNGSSSTYYADAIENEILDGEVSVLAATDYFVNKFDGDVLTSYNYMNSAALRATLAMAGYTARTTIADDLTIYVNAATGSDTNNGQTANTAYATIGAAFNAAKAHLGKTGRKSVVINLAAGKYHVTETMLLSKDDILADAYSFTVIGQGDNTIITSEVELDRDTLYWDDATGAAVVQLQANADGSYPALRAVYANGELVPVSHYGDSENTTKTLAFRIEDASGNTLATTGNDWTLSAADKAKAAYAVFTLPGEMFTADELSAYAGTEIHMTIQWTSHIVHIAKLAQNNNGTVAAYVPYGELPGLNSSHNFAESCVWLQNSLPLLYENGDTVYYDQANGKLYLMENNISVSDLDSYAYAGLTQIFKLDGVKNVTFEKVAFTGIDSKYITPDNGIACGQSASITLHKSDRTYTKPGFQEDAAIFAKNVDGLTVKNVSVYGALSTGITVKGVNKNIAIDSSRFENLGGTAIQLGDDGLANSMKNVAVTNNYVHEIGQLYKAACAINITFVANAKIIGNTVTRVPYTGISIGRMWATVGTDANNIIQGGQYNTFNVEVAYNYVSDFMMCSKDGGAFYLLGGNIRRDVNDKTFYNFMHHNYVNLSYQTGRYNGNDNSLRFTMGYYHDNSSSNWLDYENVLINTAMLSNANAWFYAYYLQDIEGAEAQNVKLQDNYLIGFDTAQKIFIRDTVLNADFGIESSNYVYANAAALQSNTALTNLGTYGTGVWKASPANASTNVAAIFAACGSSIAPAVQHQSGLSWSAPAATREILMDTERTDAGSFGKTTYTVTFKGSDGTTVTNNVLAGSKLSIPSMFEEAGKVYTFSVGGVAIDPATYVTPAANVTIDVLVEAQKFNVTIKDGSTTTELEVAVGETFELPAAYAKEGYVTKLTYDGNEIDLATFEMPAYDIDVRVAYEIGSYTVTFTDGETTVTHKGVYKTGVPTPTAFVAPTGYKVVYSIEGVDVSVVGMTVPGKDVTVDVRYEKATYNAIFKANGKTHATVPTVYGDAIVLPAAPATYSEGGYTYTFKAWTGYTEGMTIGAENVTFEAEWTRTANEYDVKFSYTIDGVETVVDTQTVTFGTAITAPALPESFDRDGFRYTFTGWEGYTEGMLLETEGATFVAVYEKTEIPTGIVGDINGDGVVDISDITAVISAASGTALDPEQFPGDTDLTADGLVDISDITAVIAIASGSTVE